MSRSEWYATGLLASLILALLCGCQGIPPIDDWPLPPVDDGLTTTTTSTTTTTQPPVSTYRITRVTSGDIGWTGPDLTWPVVNGDCCGEAHLYRADGRGGKFDHVRRATKWRDWKNIHSGYGCWSSVGEPANGERCRLVLVRYGGGERVEVGEFRWVR